MSRLLRAVAQPQVADSAAPLVVLGAQRSAGGLPWLLAPLRLQGFLGRQWARSAAAAGFDANPERWRIEQLLSVLLRERPDLPGAGRLGSGTPASAQMLPTSAAARLTAFDALADLAASTLPAGSSAGGEQAKLLANDAQVQHWLVKFSPPHGTPFGERWHDLPLAEALALAVLAEHGVPVATAHVRHSARRTHLASVARPVALQFWQTAAGLAGASSGWRALAAEMGRRLAG